MLKWRSVKRILEYDFLFHAKPEQQQLWNVSMFDLTGKIALMLILPYSLQMGGGIRLKGAHDHRDVS